MLASFFSWWIARISELLPASWTRAGAGAPDGIVVDMGPGTDLSVSLRRKGREQAITLDIAARLAARRSVYLRPPPGAVLEKHHTVPTGPWRELAQLLRYEIARITPFTANDLFWRWDGRPKAADKSRTDVTLTLIPKDVVIPALHLLQTAGIQPRFLETGAAERPRLVAIEDETGRRTNHLLFRGLAWTCAALAAVALVLPVLRQELAIHATNVAIDDLQPSIRQVEALRRGMTADGAEQKVLAQEMERTGDLLQILATVTNILPDDTYLTEFSLRDRQMTLGGRSAAAARLITALSANPAIRDAVFAAPVIRIEGATTDVFSIRASVTK
jgi:general secretion pathway protein L